MPTTNFYSASTALTTRLRSQFNLRQGPGPCAPLPVGGANAHEDEELSQVLYGVEEEEESPNWNDDLGRRDDTSRKSQATHVYHVPPLLLRLPLAHLNTRYHHRTIAAPTPLDDLGCSWNGRSSFEDSCMAAVAGNTS